MASKICLGDIDNSQYNIEDPSLPSFIPESITRNYTIQVLDGNKDRRQAELDLLQNSLCPLLDPSYGLLHRKSISVTSVEGVFDQFEASVTWQKWEPEQQGEEFLGGSISIETETIYREFKNVSVNWAENLKQESRKDYGGMINVHFGSGDGNKGGVDGTEVAVPKLTFSIRKYYAKNTFNLALLANLNGYVGRPNTTTWRNFTPHTLMITGITGSDQDPDKDEITWNFQASPTDTNIIIPCPITGTDITVPEKRGFDYLWLITETHDDSQGWAMEAPVGAIVSQLVPDVELNAILP